MLKRKCKALTYEHGALELLCFIIVFLCLCVGAGVCVSTSLCVFAHVVDCVYSHFKVSSPIHTLHTAITHVITGTG